MPRLVRQDLLLARACPPDSVAADGRPIIGKIRPVDERYAARVLSPDRSHPESRPELSASVLQAFLRA